jgi:hypothetical protein
MLPGQKRLTILAAASIDGMAVRNASQLARRRQLEAGLRLVAPLLDLVLAAGDRVSRVAGRNEIAPEPPRRALRARDQARR